MEKNKTTKLKGDTKKVGEIFTPSDRARRVTSKSLLPFFTKITFRSRFGALNGEPSLEIHCYFTREMKPSLFKLNLRLRSTLQKLAPNF